MGLGGNASTVSLGTFSLGIGTVEVSVTPVTPTTGGVGGRFTDWMPRRRRESLYDDITITLRTESNTWTQTLRVERNRTPVIIRIVAVINRITTNVTAKMTAMRSVLSKIRIK